jgi:DNA invertase Pin-like site-specific DNA recombinase
MSLKMKTPKRSVGYARISTVQQDLTRQLQALKGEGCAKVFSDTASGKSMAGRPELDAALAELGEGDELVNAEWDRATRSMWDGLHIIKAVIDAGATIRVLDRSYIDLSTPIGSGFMAMFSAMAEDERGRIMRKLAQGRDVKMGRKEKLNELQKGEARKRLTAGEIPADLAPLYGVSRATIARLRYGKEKS